MADLLRFLNEHTRSNSRINGEAHSSLRLLHPISQDEEEESELFNYSDDDDHYENAAIISSSNDFQNALIPMHQNGTITNNDIRSRVNSRRDKSVPRTHSVIDDSTQFHLIR